MSDVMSDDDEVVADRVLPYPMIALAASAAIVVGIAAIEGAAVVNAPTVAGVVVIVVGLVLVLVLRRSPPARGSAWIGLIPLSCVIAASLLRDPSFAVVPSGALLVILPIGWLGFAFPPAMTALGVAISTVLPMVNVVVEGGDPVDAWGRIVAFPALVSVFALSTHAIGRQIRASRHRVRQVSGQLDEEARRYAQQAATVSALTHDSPVAVVIFDAAGTPIQANRRAHALTARAGGDGSLDLAPHMHIYASDRETPLVTEPAPLAEFLEREGERTGTTWIGPPGDQVAVRYIARRIHDERGDDLGSIVIAQEVTDLIEAIDVRDRFLDTVEHELRSPLTVLVGHVDMARDETDPVLLGERVAAIDRAASKLLAVVERLIASRRAEIAQLSWVDVDFVIGESVGAVASDAATNGVAVTVGPGSGGVSAHMSARDLRAILVELLRNAIAFTPSGGTVEVAVHPDGDETAITVTDAGVGMTPEESRRAFERFYRAPYARTNAVPGAGVGLAIAAALAAANGSRLELHSTPGEGTIATLRVPAREER